MVVGKRSSSWHTSAPLLVVITQKIGGGKLPAQVDQTAPRYRWTGTHLHSLIQLPPAVDILEEFRYGATNESSHHNLFPKVQSLYLIRHQVYSQLVLKIHL